ncbi:hypothetical protein CLIB1444_06S06524 [[Candida] jaroonii]|uniref:Uncharacterized protein n=1 Tax=[Candida] jaroonii TaxID=467808 RepID=A0ACA9Y9B0_9ASCO|nr:hypothetical protein CLIB1444_06S06524 [[Candida] jaroonii]
MSAYIIPPYILHTSLGAKLEKVLKEKDHELAESNSVALSGGEEIVIEQPAQYKFSSDNGIHTIIKEKLLYKLGIMGVLGTSLKPPDQYTDEETFEYFEIFKHRLLSEDKDDKKFNASRFGEVIVSHTPIGDKYKKFMDYTLKELLLASKLETDGSKNTVPPFFKIGDDYFNYSLPSTWVSLTPAVFVNKLTEHVDLNINHNDGFCNLQFKTIGGNVDNNGRNKYLNFITNNPIPSSTGIFYYEVEILQHCTDATDHIPLLSIQDSTISSNQSPQFNLGFVKRHVNYDKRLTVINEATKFIVDLEDVKKELVLNQDDVINRPLNMNFEHLLDSRPGEFKDSLALDLSDGYFYNSIKDGEPRHTILNMNRRLSSFTRQLDEDSRINTDINFSTVVQKQSDVKILKSDIIGMGVNYITKSMFITLNGVLIKEINQEDIEGTNLTRENLFDEEIYPMIGFMVNEVKITKQKEPTELVIKTNLGFKDFEFNINHYVLKCKDHNSKKLDLSLVQSSPKKDLNELIKEYLNVEGYIDTFKALNSDLAELNQFTGFPDLDIEPIDGTNRNHLKRFFKEYEFDKILSLLDDQYNEVFGDEGGKTIIFDIKINHLMFRLNKHIDKVLAGEVTDIADLWTSITALNSEYKGDHDKMEKIKQYSVFILIKDSKGLGNLPGYKKLRQLDELNQQLFSKVNKKILKSRNFKDISGLESIVTTVENNIKDLNLQYCDNDFALINFERDKLDL